MTEGAEGEMTWWWVVGRWSKPGHVPRLDTGQQSRGGTLQHDTITLHCHELWSEAGECNVG